MVYVPKYLVPLHKKSTYSLCIDSITYVSYFSGSLEVIKLVFVGSSKTHGKIYGKWVLFDEADNNTPEDNTITW